EAFLILPDRSSFAASAGLQQWRVARPESSKGVGAATPFADSGRATRPYGNHDLPSLLPALAIRRTQTILENTTRPISGQFIAEWFGRSRTVSVLPGDRDGPCRRRPRHGAGAIPQLPAPAGPAAARPAAAGQAGRLGPRPADAPQGAPGARAVPREH